MKRLDFRIEATTPGSSARAGRLHTLHGEVLTPLFMPVGTRATVKTQDVGELAASGSQILLANTYHLALEPGVEIFETLGGIHRFMNWGGSVLTDSGGFQLFSLHEDCKVDDEGASIRLPKDGSLMQLSPERSIEIQRAIGSDIMMAFDQCIPSTADKSLATAALERTARWAERSLAARGESPQALFGIVQGALYPDLRRLSASQICSLPFDGFAIGGLAVGESKAEREAMCELSAALLPPGRPRYLMGVGTPIDLLEAVHRGVDMFDCIIPTQHAQQGVAYSSRGILQFRRSVYRLSDAPLDPSCSCSTCTTHSRAYLHHLIRCKEPTGWRLIAAHNIYFYHRLMERMRSSILEGSFAALYREEREQLGAPDLDNPPRPPASKRRDRMQLGAYRIVHHSAGHAAIEHRESRERMHCQRPPIDEARELYVEQSRLAHRLAQPGGELVVWDVGLGAGANAMATLHCHESAAEARPLSLVSFENDLDSLRLARRHTHLFPYLRHPGPAAILERGEWSGERLRWKLLEGDFRERLHSAELQRPDLIFFDMFSHKSAPELWSYAVFQMLHERCTEGACELITYSSATGIRSALLAAGFYVAEGVSSGSRHSTTHAFTAAGWEARGDVELLGQRWLERFQRSTRPLPPSLGEEEAESLRQRVLAHPQFQD